MYHLLHYGQLILLSKLPEFSPQCRNLRKENDDISSKIISRHLWQCRYLESSRNYH